MDREKMFDIISNDRFNEWAAFSEHHSDATIFHHPSWLTILNQQYSFRPFIICEFDIDQKLIGGIPFCEVRSLSGRKKWVSLPFSDMCSPLVSDVASLKDLLDYAKTAAESRGIKSIEVRWVLPEGIGFQSVTNAVIHTTPLIEELDELFLRFKKTQVQQPIVKSQKEGLQPHVTNNMEHMEKFYDLHTITRKRLGVPVQPKKFFVNIFHELIETGLGYIVTVKKDEQIMASGIFCGFGETMSYKFGASDEKALRYRPNNLLLWEAMREAKRRGFTRFDFGRSDVENQGLRKFKSGWASVEEPLFYSYFPVAPSGDGLLKKVEQSIVTPVIKNTPLFVCRIIGELFYKYVA